MLNRSSSVVVFLAVCSALASGLAGPAAAFDAAFKAIPGGAFDVTGGPIRFALEPEGTEDVDGDADLEALRASFRAWACVEGTSVRFEEDDAPGVAAIDDSDDKNTLFWDETGALCGMGGGTLGITVGDAGGGSRNQADICFNGRDADWGVGERTDIQSIAMHEIGHFIGLDHPCDNDADEASCLPPTEAIMFPSWSGVNEREPLSSDAEGVRTLYPENADLPSGCNGPFGPGERCDCNDACVDGLICVPDGQQVLRCGRACSADDADCGSGSTCVLDVPQDGLEAPGVCVTASTDKPAGSVCTVGGECASGTCAPTVALGRSICQLPCETEQDCAGGSCFEGLCLGGFEAVECVAEEVPGCGCASSSASSLSLSPPIPAGPGVVAVGGLLLLLRRRRAVARCAAGPGAEAR